ncbi:hypothetical protein LCGC14_0995080 [marine sediment metagenome]|uniref:Uncharacterized protein n=1 Tax=marine sediment metagenome TaxID=412755 RepID=A0A0F9QN48_9ZZZZ
MKWRKFDSNKNGMQKLPPIKRWVLLKLEGSFGIRGAIIVGYRKNHAGCNDEPYFATPGGGALGQVTHWADCLGNQFEWLPDDRDD